MTSDPAHIRNLRQLSRGDPDFSQLAALEAELYGENDRAAAILLTAMVERSLRKVIMGNLRSDLSEADEKEVFGFNGPLGSFSAAIKMSHAMGLIGTVTRDDLDLIRFLRNSFAHSRVPLSFKTSEVIAVCEKLQMVDIPGATIPVAYFDKIPKSELETIGTTKHPRTRFVVACYAIAYRMLLSRETDPEILKYNKVEGVLLP